ncbi:hypothetical protein [Flavobacterium psychrotolerans]|uniref:Uncharacterized protein n=1 Tax=Flavobacterium psychrotolerans TaxID=2169410 RepID=A0A2U1JN54_9FLAO|nr:hypothetical protein [Flavobacterium psychrotolerans]PWA06596.1 hypothetical protein DB895_04060 [Flavobacterium psychrotolerans]
MKKTFLHKLLIGFSAIAIFVYGAIYACAGGDDWGIEFDTNFTPETFVDKSYTPLFLSTDLFFYGIGFDDIHNSRFNDEIVQDWSDFLKGKMDDKTVKFFLIDSRAVDVAKLQSFYISQKNNPISDKWSKKIDLNDRKISSFITFLALSKQIETASVGDANNWSYEPVAQKKFNDIKLIKAIEKRYNTVSDAFLKNRYWFQTVKAYFYSGDKQSTISFFQKTENTVLKNTLYYRALAYIAGINFKNKNYALSNYQYSQVFDKCPAMRVVAAYCFRPQENLDWNQSLAMAKSNEEKAALWAIQGYYGDEQKAIEKIYELQPKSEHLDYLLTRLVNNQEKKLNEYNPDQKTIDKFKKSNDSLSIINNALVNRIALAENTSKPHLWDIAAGYLETLGGNYLQADKYFDKAEAKMPKTPLAINQLRLLQFVNNLSKIKNINSENQKTILQDLQWLYEELPKQELSNFRYQNASNWSKIYLSNLYKSQNNNVMAELFVRNSNFYDNENDLHAMKTFLAKENKTVLEKIAQKIYNVTLFDINEYQSVAAAFQNKIPDAIAYMQQTDRLQLEKFQGNPFNGNVKDCHDCDFVAYQKRKYSQIEFLTTVKEMQDKVTKNKDVYTNCILLANAFYNITYFGNARIFYEGNIIGAGSSPYGFKNKTREMITNCSIPKMYYEKAFEAAITDEQKAKCQFMLAKCGRNEYYNQQYDPKKDSWENETAVENSKVNFLAWNGFKNLKNNYSKTKFYQEVIAECGYFKTYVSKAKK